MNNPLIAQYLEKLVERHKNLHLQTQVQSAQAHSVELNTLYVDVTVHLSYQDPYIRQPSYTDTQKWLLAEGLEPQSQSIDTLTSNYLFHSEYLRRDETQLSIDDLWARHSQWVLLGEPGAGKTTLLTYLALHYAARYQHFQQGFLPIPITLRLFSHAWQRNPHWSIDEALLKYFCEQVTKEWGLSGRQRRKLHEQLLEQLHNMQIVWLLDGLDEHSMVKYKKRMVNAVEAMLERFPGNRCLVSSRPIGYYDAPLHGGFQVANIEPFTPAQTRLFFYHWFCAVNHVQQRDSPAYQQAIQQADTLLEQLYALSGVPSLTQTPLLCAIIALVYHHAQTLPPQRSTLFKQCIDTFSFEWENQKRRKTAPLLPPAETQAVLEAIALHLQEHCPEQCAAAEQIRTVMVDYLHHSGLAIAEADARATQLMQLIREVSGLLVDKGNEIYGFFHLSLQEYLVARAVIRNPRQLNTYLERYTFQSRWHEVLRLIATLEGELSAQAGGHFLNKIFQQGHERNHLMHYSFRLAFWCLPETCTDAVVEQRFLRHWIALYLKQAVLAIPLLSLLKRQAVRHNVESSVLQPLYQALSKQNKHLRRRVVQAFGYLADEKTTKYLIASLRHDPDDLVRSYAAQALGQLAIIDALSGLIHALQFDVEPIVRRHAALALGKLGSIAAITTLQHICETDRDTETRQQTINALGMLNNRDALQALDELMHKHPDEETRQLAAQAIGQHNHPQVVKTVVRLIQTHPEVNVRQVLATHISPALAPTVAQQLIVSWEHKTSYQAQRQIVEALGYLPLPGQRRIDLLIDIVRHHSDEILRWRAAQALGHCKSPQAVQALTHVLCHDQDDWVRWRAAEALWQLKDPAAAEALQQALQHDQDDSVRGRAAEALGMLGNPTAINALIYVLQQEADTDVHERAAQILGRLQQPEAAPVLINMLQHHAMLEMRKRAVQLLGGIETPEVIAALIDALEHDKDSGIRRLAAESLGRLAAPAALPSLLRSLRADYDPTVRWRSAEALGRFIEYEQVLPALVRAIQKDHDEWVRWRATEALTSCSDEVAVKILCKLLRHHLDNGVRWRAASGLERLQDAQALPTLIDALQNDSVLMVRESAARAIEKIDMGGLI